MVEERKIPVANFKWDLTGTDNNGFRHRYSILKDESFKENFLNFMDGLGFNWEEVERRFEYEDSDGQFVSWRIIELLDLCWHFENSNFDVDVFFGSSKIILVVRTKDRRKLIDKLVDLSEFISPLTYDKLELVESEGIVIENRID